MISRTFNPQHKIIHYVSLGVFRYDVTFPFLVYSAVHNHSSWLGLENLAATTVLLDRLAPERDTSFSTLGASCSWLSLHTCLDLAGHGEESLFNIGGSLGRSLEELDSERVSKFLSLLSRHDTLGGQIGLVANQKLVNILTGISVNFMQPLLYIVERLIVSDVVNNDDTVSTTVIGRCDCTEAFLSSGVPNLELDSFSVKLNGTDFLLGATEVDYEIEGEV
jgi:hypothetical protein